MDPAPSPSSRPVPSSAPSPRSPGSRRVHPAHHARRIAAATSVGAFVAITGGLALNAAVQSARPTSADSTSTVASPDSTDSTNSTGPGATPTDPWSTVGPDGQQAPPGQTDGFDPRGDDEDDGYQYGTDDQQATPDTGSWAPGPSTPSDPGGQGSRTGRPATTQSHGS